jgi:hypothetical protein
LDIRELVPVLYSGTTAGLRRHRIGVVSLAKNNYMNDRGPVELLETTEVLSVKLIAVIGAEATDHLARLLYPEVSTS